MKRNNKTLIYIDIVILGTIIILHTCTCQYILLNAYYSSYYTYTWCYYLYKEKLHNFMFIRYIPLIILSMSLEMN